MAVMRLVVDRIPPRRMVARLALLLVLRVLRLRLQQGLLLLLLELLLEPMLLLLLLRRRLRRRLLLRCEGRLLLLLLRLGGEGRRHRRRRLRLRPRISLAVIASRVGAALGFAELLLAHLEVGSVPLEHLLELLVKPGDEAVLGKVAARH